MARKLKALKENLKTWNEHAFEELKGLDSVEEVRELFDEERARNFHVSVVLEMVSLLEEISWRQKSNTLWLKEGGKCTKFFHWVANTDSWNNGIETLLVDGLDTSDQTTITNHIVKYYEHSKYSLNALDLQEEEWLEWPLEEMEIQKVVSRMVGDKTPSPYGFSKAFFQICWNVTKDDIMGVFS